MVSAKILDSENSLTLNNFAPWWRSQHAGYWNYNFNYTDVVSDNTCRGLRDLIRQYWDTVLPALSLSKQAQLREIFNFEKRDFYLQAV